MSSSNALLCEIHAPRAAEASALAAIAAALGRDIGQPLTVKTLKIGPTASSEPVLTLHLPAELAASQHRAWCLACRLACFCPGARVSVLVLGERAFSHSSQNGRARTRHVA